MIKMYGIPNCDTVKKARAFLEKTGVAYEFVDFKKTPPTKSDLELWKDAFGEWPVNKKGPTFRKFKAEYDALSEAKQLPLIIANPSMIKRPILMDKNKVLAFGFDEARYREVV